MAFSLAHDVYIGDHMVRIRCAGTGRPLLLLHDIGGCGASFAGLTSAIVDIGREAVAPDLPGFAQSDPIAGEMPELLDHLQEFVDRTIEDPVDVVGHGFGGYLALGLAAQRPERFRRIVLQDPMTPPAAGGRATARMGAAMALSGAYTTVRRGRILQNVGGFGRARHLLESLAKSDQAWWDGLSAIEADVLLLDLGGSRADTRSRLHQLAAALSSAKLLDLSDEKGAAEPGGALERELLAFVS
ncbi:MAG: alpha/beta fold hydrolase [Nakamurella sp.]